MHLTSNYVHTSYNQADFWNIYKQKDWPISSQETSSEEEGCHLDGTLLLRAAYCLNATRSLVWNYAALRNMWKNAVLPTFVSPFTAMIFTFFCFYWFQYVYLGFSEWGENNVIPQIKEWCPGHTGIPGAKTIKTFTVITCRLCLWWALTASFSGAVPQHLNCRELAARNNDPFPYHVIIWKLVLAVLSQVRCNEKRNK